MSALYTRIEDILISLEHVGGRTELTNLETAARNNVAIKEEWGAGMNTSPFAVRLRGVEVSRRLSTLVVWQLWIPECWARRPHWRQGPSELQRIVRKKP